MVLEASQSIAGKEEHLPVAFLLQLWRETARTEIFICGEDQLPSNLSLLVVVDTSIAEDNEELVETFIHEVQGFHCHVKHLSSIEL